jgi:hypothetical protein
MASKREIEAAATSMEGCMFAPHELPLVDDLHKQYTETARLALEAAEYVRFLERTVGKRGHDARTGICKTSRRGTRREKL